MDALGSPDAVPEYLVDAENAWPARRITATVDESYVHLRISLRSPRPAALTLGFDVLPGVTGLPAPNTSDGDSDAAFTLDLAGHTGQAYLRDELDPLPLDHSVPAAARGPSSPGWKPFDLVVDRALTIPTTGEKLPAELQDAGSLRYGTPADDSRAVWYTDGDDLVVRAPWALLGYADPSAHQVGVPRGKALTTEVSPGVGVTVSASGTDQRTGEVTWVNWNRPYYSARLKQGAGQFRDAALEVIGTF